MRYLIELPTTPPPAVLLRVGTLIVGEERCQLLFRDRFNAAKAARLLGDAPICEVTP